MAQIKFSGPFMLRTKSMFRLCGIMIATSIRHMLGRKMAPDWDAQFETGVRFIRRQFTDAMKHDDIVRGRLLFDSVQLETDDVYDVVATPTIHPPGTWWRPAAQNSDAVLLYLHGGGYTFHGGVSDRFAAMLAHHTGACVYAPTYRLTPEHPHPAQAEDALTAWRFLTKEVSPEKIVLVGDSAGGHMALMLLQTLRATGERQPALCIGLCPWTDVGERGASMRENDHYDLVQGWMALQFGAWLDPAGVYGRGALSPIAYDFTGLAPLYLQAGGREMLRDMIVDFARKQAELGAEVLLDVWPDMPHDFQAYDSLKASSAEALVRIRQAVDAHVAGGPGLRPLPGVTVVSSGDNTNM